MSSAASGRNYLHSVYGITASLPQVRDAFKVFDAYNERHYFGEQAGPMGLLRWLEEQKNDTSYCVWQASPQSLELPSMERNANIIFNEETIDGTTTKTDLTEMCQDVMKGCCFGYFLVLSKWTSQGSQSGRSSPPDGICPNITRAQTMDSKCIPDGFFKLRQPHQDASSSCGKVGIIRILLTEPDLNFFIYKINV
eukprot:scaffold6277_cov109-Amphora_coffeaeformis.AAC.1